MLSGILNGWRSYSLSCFTRFRYARSAQRHTLTCGQNPFGKHTDESIAVRCMHKLGHTQVAEHTITTVFRKRRGTTKGKQNAQYAISPFDNNGIKSSVKSCLNRIPQQLQQISHEFLNERHNSWGNLEDNVFLGLHKWSRWFWEKKEVNYKRALSFLLSVENAKYCPFIASPGVDEPAADCELEPNNQSAVVSIVMLSPTGKKEWQRDTWQSAARLRVLCHEYTKKYTRSPKHGLTWSFRDGGRWLSFKPRWIT